MSTRDRADAKKGGLVSPIHLQNSLGVRNRARDIGAALLRGSTRNGLMERLGVPVAGMSRCSSWTINLIAMDL